jgi:hypothetical protein
MELKRIFANWTAIASVILIGGSLAWAIKLTVIISTNGRIIDTGAAALLMKIGILLLLIGSTSLGSGISTNRSLFLRVVSFLLSPVFLFGTCFLLTTALNPLVKDSSVWYAAQELPIAVVVVVCLPLGVFLYNRFRPALA